MRLAAHIPPGVHPWSLPLSSVIGVTSPPRDASVSVRVASQVIPRGKHRCDNLNVCSRLEGALGRSYAHGARERSESPRKPCRSQASRPSVGTSLERDGFDGLNEPCSTRTS